MRAAALASLLLLSVGCLAAPVPPLHVQRAADYGEHIAPDEALVAIKAALQSVLKDPYSAVYVGPSRTFEGWASTMGKDNVAFGRLAYVTINAKNSFGAYVGEKRYGFLLFKSGGSVRVLRHWEESEESSGYVRRGFKG